MIVQSFRSVMWVGAVAGAALSCYMVSLRVASERAALERVESRILLAKRDIRSLDTELSTRGRLRQLERWNVEVLALSPPTEGQFLTGEVQLASLSASVPSKPTAAAVDAPVMLASAAQTPVRRRALPTDAAPRARNPLLVQASASIDAISAAKTRVKAKTPVTAKSKSKSKSTSKSDTPR